MKINHITELPDSVLDKIEDIWQMDRAALNGLVDELYQWVPENCDYYREYFGEELGDAVMKRYDELCHEEEKKRNAEVEVDLVTYKTVNFFDLYHLGWEMDTKAWIVEKDGKQALVHSNHGTPYFVTDPVAFLNAKVKELSANVKVMKIAISQLELNG